MRLDELERVEVPGSRAAEERAWATVAGAFEAREPAPRRRALRLAVVAVVAAAVAVTPAGPAVADWVREVVRPAPRPALPPFALPAPGRLLLETPAGTSIVDAAGKRRSLGAWRDATWSPRGRFVAAVRGGTLAALTPGGTLRWSLRRPFRLADPAWAPDGFTIAYRSGDGLRAVAGDGSGDRFLTGPIGPAAPVWRGNAVTVADRRGRLLTVDPVSRQAAWRTAGGPRVVSLAWSPDGRTVAAISARVVRLFDARGRPARRIEAAEGERFTAGIYTPGRRLILVRQGPSTTRVTVGERTIFAGPGRIGAPVASPDGRWLLLPWQVADEWLFLSGSTGERVVPVGRVSTRLSPARAFPEVKGWE